MLNLFISYSRENKPEVTILAEDINGLGHTIWFDEELSGGQSWWDQILEHIRDCDVFLFAMTTESLESTACRREFDYAVALGKPIIPVVVAEGVSMNLLPEALSQLQVVDYKDAAEKSATLAVGKALNSIELQESLPAPLPEPPPVPISYLTELGNRLEAPTMSYEEQSALILDVKDSLRDSETSEDAKTLLKRLRDRPDLLAKTENEIDELLGVTPARSTGTAATQGNQKGKTLTLVGALLIAALGGFAAWQYLTQPPRIYDFSISKSSITAGEAITLSWETANTQSLSLTPNQNTDLKKPAGKITLTPSTSTEYKLTATARNKESTVKSVSVSVTALPEIDSFSVSNKSIRQGESTTLSWETSGATFVSLKPTHSEQLSLDGEISLSPMETTEYTLIARGENSAGEEQRFVISVTDQPPQGASTTGTVGYLSDSLEGNLTASGSRYDANKHTASKQPALETALGPISWGTKVKVTNVVEEKSVIVRIIDKGGSTRPDRLLDLSRSAFEAIADLEAGIANVRVELIPSSP